MRLPARRLASTALCAALLAGVTGPAAVAADPAREHSHSTYRTPVPGGEKLLVQVRALDSTGAVLQPVLDLLNAVLQKGRLTPEEAGKLGGAAQKAIKEAVKADPASLTQAMLTPPAAQAASTVPAAPAAPGSAAVPAAPAKPGVPATAAKPAKPAKQSDDGKPGAARDRTKDALTDLQGTVDKLVKAVQGLDVGSVLSAATGVVSGLVNVVTGLLGGLLGTLGQAAPASAPTT